MFRHQFTQHRLITFALLGLILAASAAFAVSKFQASAGQEIIIEPPVVTGMGGSVLWP